MAIISFDIRDLRIQGVPQEKVLEAILGLGIEIEEKTSKELKLNITPNRPDLLDFTGLVRAIENFAGKRVPRENFYRIKNKPELTISVTEEVYTIRPYIAGMVVKNADLSGNMLKYLINFTDKFADTYGRRRKKLAIGIHSLNAIKGNITYTASGEGSFKPLNSTRPMSFSDIINGHDKGAAYRDTIPKNESGRTLYPYIADSEKTLALIPIINSDATKLSPKTRDLFIDITGTSKTTIRNAAALLACSFMYAGAGVYPVIVSYPMSKETTPALSYDEIKVSLKVADETLGIEAGRHNVITLANRMGYVASKYGSSVLFYVPPYRVDVLNDQDAIEDIAVAFGYDRIVPMPVKGIAEGLASEQYELEDGLASFMVGLGYSEAVNSMLTNEKLNFDSVMKKYEEESYVSVADAKTSSITMLRTSLLPGLLQNLAGSRAEKLPQRLFEIGRVFSLSKGKIKESVKLLVVSEHAKANFAEMRSVADSLLKYMGISYKVKPGESSANIEGRTASIVVGDEIMGRIGEVHPQVLENFGLEEPVVSLSLTLVKEVKY